MYSVLKPTSIVFFPMEFLGRYFFYVNCNVGIGILEGIQFREILYECRQLITLTLTQ